MFESYLFFCLHCFAWFPVAYFDQPDLNCATDNQHHNLSRAEEGSRSGRFVTFNKDESHVSVELNFAVPFLEIPVGGKSLEKNKEGSNSIIDVNTKSLITASALIIMFVFFAPRVIRLILPNAKTPIFKGRSDGEVGSIIHDVDAILKAMRIDTDACWQRAVCVAIQTSSKNVNNRQGSSWNMIIDGLARNDILQYMVRGTLTYQAIKSGLMEDQCNLVYKSCNFDIKDLLMFFRKAPLS